MLRHLKKCILPAAVLCLLWVIFALSITLCAMIPKSAVEKNIKKCTDYYINKYMFQQMTKDEHSTTVHNYADLVWLNIAWSQDSEKPFTSALGAAFYEGKNIYKNESLYRAVYGGKTPDKSYSRYWHGALIFIKPLLTVTDITGIRVINAVVCVLCAAAVVLLLIKRRLYTLLAGYITAPAVSFVYIIPLCMEYMPAFVLTHIAAILILVWGHRQKRHILCTFFVSVGALICFFDFLTNEILTLFVPLLFLIWQNAETEKIRVTFKDAFLYCVSWFSGYALTWVCKWGLCFAVLGKSEFENAVSNGAYRMMGTVPYMKENQFVQAVVMNLNRLFPLNFAQSSTAVCLIAAAIVFVLFCVFFLYRKENLKREIWLTLLIAFTPYMRYICLSNHSCLHPVFTFRTQIITVIALFAFMGEGIDVNLIFKRSNKKCVKKN